MNAKHSIVLEHNLDDLRGVVFQTITGSFHLQGQISNSFGKILNGTDVQKTKMMHVLERPGKCSLECIFQSTTRWLSVEFTRLKYLNSCRLKVPA